MVFKRTIFLFLLQYIVIVSSYHSLDTDKVALLAFKRAISYDPHSVLINWNETTHVCNFTRVNCNKQHHRISRINLTNTDLVGSLSPAVSNLTRLRVLIIVNNNLFGEIPTGISSLRHLRWLWLEGNKFIGTIPELSLLKNLTYLNLRENNLSGEIPISLFSNCTLLKNVDLSVNSLSGNIPLEVGNCAELETLELYNNQFTGIIPTGLSSLRHLRWLWLEGNKFIGTIPELSLLKNLTYLNLRANNLSGEIPISLFSNCTSLKNVDLSVNSLSGNIPSEIGNCAELVTLELYNNQFSGIIPLSLMNASQLGDLDVEFTHISGELPSDIVSKLPGLAYLHLSYTQMYSHDNNTNIDPFFSALGNCTYLQELELAGLGLGGILPSSIGKLGAYLGYLFLQENNFSSSIPSNIANLTSLTWLNLTFNLLSGTIPSGISNLTILEQLFLSHNFFSGQIPSYFGEFPRLGLLDLSYNRLSGEIPKSLCNLVMINFLFLNNNLLSGPIPPDIGKCRDLSKLDFSHNRLTGGIPTEIANLREIRIFLNFSHNFLNGSLPIELSKLLNVLEIDLSSNNFTGNVIFQLGSCISLTLLNLSNNLLQGNLPESLDKLIYLDTLDVSRNNLSGKIPESLSKIATLNFLNLSFNDFNGKIPSGGIFRLLTYQSFLGNTHLCGSISGIRKCHRRKINFHSPIVLVIFCIIISLLLFAIACCVIACHNLKRVISVEKVVSVKKSPPDIKLNFPRITYKELSDATLGFSGQRLIGSGGYGHVYRGVLSDGTPIAIKVLQLQTGNSTKSFNRECQVLKRIRHRNLIRIITACSLPDFKAIVLPYMANGSLDSRLYPLSRTGLGSGSSDLSLILRVNICSDIAEGMAYLHHHSPVKVIHCDLKPSNVLLNDDMTALVSDFGISRLIMTVEAAGVVENMGNSTANRMCGSIGYIAPEYGFGSNSTTKGDVYSFGILILEMVTRKRPTDDMFAVDLTLPKWVKSHYHGRTEKVIDSSLLRAMRDQSSEVKKMWEVAIGEMIELGLLCTQYSPSTRPTMLDAADDLDRLKRYLSGDTATTFASSLGISSSTLDEDLL